MVDNVKLEFDGDPDKANAAIDKLKAKISTLVEQNEKQKNSSKANAEKMGQDIEKYKTKIEDLINSNKKLKESSDIAGEKMAKNFAVATVAAQVLEKVVTKIAGQFDKIREQKDSAVRSADKVTTDVMLEGGARFKESDRAALKNLIFDTSIKTGAKKEDVGEAFKSALNNGANFEDLKTGKYNADLKLALTTGGKSDGITDILDTSLRKEKLENNAKNREKMAGKLYAGFGKDIGEGTAFLRNLPDNVSIDQGLAMFNIGKVSEGGSAKGAASMLEKSMQPGGGGINKFKKLSGATDKEIQETMAEIAKNEGGMNQAMRFFDTSVEADENRAESRAEKAKSKKGGRTEEAKRNDNTAKNYGDGDQGVWKEGAKAMIPIVNEDTKQWLVDTYFDTDKNNMAKIKDAVYLFGQYFQGMASKTATEIGNKPIQINDSKVK